VAFITKDKTPHGVKNQAQHIKVPPKPDSEKAVENLIHHRNPGPNIKTSYEDQPLAKYHAPPKVNPENPKNRNQDFNRF
jgi:hypothetical protein